MNAAEGLIMAAGVYLAIGMLWGTYFVLRRVDRIDRSATTATRGFRLMILPGACLLWPLTLSWSLRRSQRDAST